MVDDIDVAADKSYDILQKIFQYLMIPNVIVLTTFHMDTLIHVLEESTVDVTEYITKQAFSNRYSVNEFLRKIIPVDRRVVMPSWKRMDYRQLFPLEINIGEGGMIQRYDNTETNVDMTKVFPRLYQHSFLYILSKNAVGEERKISPKQLIFCMLADRTGVYLDVCGTKRHFMEPDSLRHMYDLFRFFYYMEDFRIRDISFQERGYRVSLNLKALLDLFHFKMVPELELKQIEKDYFDDITAEPFDRRLKKAMHQLWAPAGIIDPRVMAQRLDNPSYGDLLYELYQASRTNVRSKKFVQAVLANFSFTLPAVFSEYIKLKKAVKREEKMLSSKQLKAGSPLWMEMMNHRNYLYTIFGSSCLGKWNALICTGEQNNEPWAELRCKEITHEIWLLLMLVPHDRLHKIIASPSKEGDILLQFPIDLSAFVINSFHYRSFLSKTQICFKSSLPIERYEYGADKLRFELEIYDQKDSYMALPLQHTDLLYNVIKRSVSCLIYRDDFMARADKEKIANLNALPLYDVIKQFYLNLAAELNEQDFFYHFGYRTDFSNRFLTCPVIKMFLEPESDMGSVTYNLKRINDPTADDIKIWRE